MDNRSVKALFFFEVPRIAQLSASALGQPAVALLPTSDRAEVEAALGSHEVDAVLLPARSAESWLDLESQIGHLITMPRLLVVASVERATRWNPQIADESGFDGLVIHDRKFQPHEFADRFAEAVRSCTTAGARRPTQLSALTRTPSVEEMTLGDTSNAQILHLMSFGRTHDEIAQGVGLATQTVRNRISRMIQRADVRNHTELTITYEQALARQKLLMELEARP